MEVSSLKRLLNVYIRSRVFFLTSSANHAQSCSNGPGASTCHSIKSQFSSRVELFPVDAVTQLSLCIQTYGSDNCLSCLLDSQTGDEKEEEEQQEEVEENVEYLGEGGGVGGRWSDVSDNGAAVKESG